MFSKCGPQTIKVQDSFKGSAKSVLFLWHYLLLSIIFHCIDICMMIKKWWMKIWELSTNLGGGIKLLSQCALHWQFHLRMFWKKQKLLILSNLNHWVPMFLIFCMSYIHMKLFTTYTSLIRKRHLCDCLNYGLK